MKPKVLTDRGLKALKPARPGQRDMHWDAALPSFGVRVTDTAAASYVVMRRLGRNGPLLRRQIGLSWVVPASPLTSLAEAREKGREAVLALTAGIDPKARAEERQRLDE